MAGTLWELRKGFFGVSESFQGAQDVMAEHCTGRGARGVVAAAAPQAAALGAEILRKGGNAYDAVVTAALAETVLLPPKCGLAGDVVALRFDPEKDSPEALLAIGKAPKGLASALENGSLTERGALAVGVPGAPAGYAALASCGRLPLEQLAEPAIELAQRGFSWPAICGALSRESVDIVARHTAEETAYFPRGKPVPSGSVTRLPGLAKVLEEFVTRGRHVLEGPVGTAIVHAVRKRGGVLVEEDLAPTDAVWEPTIRASMGDLTVQVTPAPTHGPLLLESLEDASPADRPADIFARVRRALARQELNASWGVTGTSIVSAADDRGNVVVVLHSNSQPHFGSGIIVQPYDLVLSNRAGVGFSSDTSHPFFPLPGRSPVMTLHAWTATLGSGQSFLGATPGGPNQVVWNAQTLASILANVRDPGQLVVEPRWEYNGKQDRIRLEQGFSTTDAAALADAAAEAEQTGRWGLRCAQQVVLRPRATEPLVAAADPRTGGAVVAV